MMSPTIILIGSIWVATNSSAVVISNWVLLSIISLLLSHMSPVGCARMSSTSHRVKQCRFTHSSHPRFTHARFV